MLKLASDLSSDLNTLIDTRVLIQANSGGGKSWCLRRLLEQTHGQVQHLVLDPEGEFASLRERFDYVLAAKNGGDTAADPRAAGLLAERLLELGVSAVIDLYELKAHDRVRFVRLFLEALVDAPKKLWHPALVVVDEAHVYCPQQGEAESAAAVVDLATRGRKRGFCAVLATQRLSKLHKDAAAELNNKFIGRTGLDVDVKRAADELGFAKDRWREMRELEAGEFFVFGPALTREVKKVKIGPIKTTHPKAGARLAFTAPPPTAKIKALLPKLSDLPAEVEQKARTEADLRAEITRLKTDLTRKATPVSPAPKRVEISVVKPADLKRIESLIGRAEKVADRFSTKAGELVTAIAPTPKPLRSTLREANRVLRSWPGVPKSAQVFNPDEMALRMRGDRKTPEPGRRRVLVGGEWGAAPGAHLKSSDIPKGELLCLAAMAQYENGVSRPQLTALTGYKTSTRNTYIQRLNERRLLKIAGDRILANEAGVKALGSDYEPLPTGKDLQEHWLRRLPEGESKILRILIEAYPKAVDRETIGELTSFKTSTRNTYLQRLTTRELVDSMERGWVRASEHLFS